MHRCTVVLAAVHSVVLTVEAAGCCWVRQRTNLQNIAHQFCLMTESKTTYRFTHQNHADRAQVLRLLFCVHPVIPVT